MNGDAIVSPEHGGFPELDAEVRAELAALLAELEVRLEAKERAYRQSRAASVADAAQTGFGATHRAH